MESFKHQAALIRMGRLGCRLTQKDVADKLGVHPQSVSNWERGISEVPMPRLKRVCKVLELDTEKILLAKRDDHSHIVNNKIRRFMGHA